MRGRTLILAHRDELIQQAVDKLEMVACDAFHDAFHRDDANVGVAKAERNEIDKQVVVGSVQTVSRENRLEQLPTDFDFIVTDEAHHGAAATYRRIYAKSNARLRLSEYLGVYAEETYERSTWLLDSDSEGTDAPVFVGTGWRFAGLTDIRTDTLHLGVTATPDCHLRFRHA